MCASLAGTPCLLAALHISGHGLQVPDSNAKGKGFSIPASASSAWQFAQDSDPKHAIHLLRVPDHSSLLPPVVHHAPGSAT